MPSFARQANKSCSGASSTRPASSTPMSERQQMALLMQMTGGNEPSGSQSPSSRPKDRNERGETPLHLAAIKGDIEQVSKLLMHRADANVVDFAGWTPLHEACNHGWYEIAFRLLQAGANVNAKGLDDETPLHDAATNGQMKIIKILLERGADIYAKNSKGKTPLDVAASPSVVDFLLNPSLPIAESSASTRLQPRARDEKKVTSDTKKDEMEAKSQADDVYEFKASKEPVEKSPPEKPEAQEQENDTGNEIPAASPSEQDPKRNFAEISETTEDSSTGNDEESRRKKQRKESDPKETKTATAVTRNAANTVKTQNPKNANTSTNKSAANNVNKDRKSPVDSPKAASDAETDEKADLKVPPLKIVIPQSTAGEQESGQTRNGKNTSQRTHAALPYVVASSGDAEKEATSGNNSPSEMPPAKEEKKEATGGNGEEKSHHQRVLRSSHRTGQADCSNNSSPQLQRSHSPSPSASPAAAAASTTEIPTTTTTSTITATASTNKSSESQASNSSDTEPSTSANNNAAGSSSNSSATTTVELHPRKRKMKPNKEPNAPQGGADALETPAVSEVHPHDQPITNCYQLYLNIRKQIDKRRKGLFPVQPKPPQGFKDYLMNRGTYVLAGRAPTTPNITYPATLPTAMKELFAEQEKERYKLRMQHVVEKEKLVLSVEQEILRVHGRAARALANQSLPFSVCTILRDEEVYNLITPEQEEKDRNARSRYNGRLFLSWLQDVDDKWEKIKEHMLLRHHNEAESLNAVQKMDWEWKMKELNLCDAKTTPKIDDLHVPMVHVSDDFDLLPA